VQHGGACGQWVYSWFTVSVFFSIAPSHLFYKFLIDFQTKYEIFPAYTVSHMFNDLLFFRLVYMRNPPLPQGDMSRCHFWRKNLTREKKQGKIRK
jgi:hypothetical protein